MNSTVALESIALCGALAAFVFLLVGMHKDILRVKKALLAILLVLLIIHPSVEIIEEFLNSDEVDLIEDLFDLLIVLAWGFFFYGCCEAIAKERLFAESQKTQRALDSLPELIWVSDTDKLCTYFNIAWLRFTGRTLTQEIGNGWTEGVHREDLPGCLQKFQTAFDLRKPFEMEYRLRRCDGEFRLISDRGVPFYQADGEFVGYIGSCFDITAKRNSDRLIRNYSRLHAAVAELGVAALETASLDPLFDKAVSLTAEVLEVDMCEILELSESGRMLTLIAGRGWHQGVVGNAVVSADENSQASYTLQTDQPVVVSELGKESRFHGPTLLLDHGVVSGISIIIQNDLKPFGILGAHSRHKRMFDSDEVYFAQAIANVLANAIRQRGAEQRLRMKTQLLHSVKESVIATDLDGQVNYWGPGAESLYGHQQQDAIGQPITLIVPPGDEQEEYQRMRFALESGFWHGEYEQKRGDGSSFMAETFISLVTDESGRPTGFVGIDRDITSRKQAEEILQRQHELVATELEKAKQQLVAQTRFATIGQISAQIAHELRNPLGAVRNAAYYLRRKIHTQESKVGEYFDLIEQEIDTCNCFITDLLEATRAKAPDRETVDLRQAIESVTARRLLPAGVLLNFSADHEPFTMSVDRTQIVQVLDNLIANALDAMNGAGVIDIFAKQTQNDSVITIQDSGTGIAEEDRDQVFEWLFTSKAKGTGLGLPICRQIVEGHGGSIELQKAGSLSGVAFMIKIPRFPR